MPEVQFVSTSTTGTSVFGGDTYTVVVNNDAVVVEEDQPKRRGRPPKNKKPEKDLEPQRYFKLLKGELKTAEHAKIQRRLDSIGQQIIRAKEIGQTAYMEQLAFTYDVLVKEQILVAKGYDNFVYKSAIKEFIDKVKPRNSIRIIELDRFPRAIPDDVLKKIAEVKAANIFDEYLVVFTDLTGQDAKEYQDKKDKDFIKRNRDPIVFGYFMNKETGLNHDRLYFIADWEDKYCDLTFDKMIDRMSREGQKDVAHTIGTDHDYLQELVKSVVDDLGKKPEEKSPLPEPIPLDAPMDVEEEEVIETVTPKTSFWDVLCPFKRRA